MPCTVGSRHITTITEAPSEKRGQLLLVQGSEMIHTHVGVESQAITSLENAILQLDLLSEPQLAVSHSEFERESAQLHQ